MTVLSVGRNNKKKILQAGENKLLLNGSREESRDMVPKLINEPQPTASTGKPLLGKTLLYLPLLSPETDSSLAK